MRRMMGYENYYHHGGGIPHNAIKSGLNVLTDYRLEDANEMMTSENWTRAMFVRDPKERALSAFCEWIFWFSAHCEVVVPLMHLTNACVTKNDSTLET